MNWGASANNYEKSDRVSEKEYQRKKKVSFREEYEEESSHDGEEPNLNTSASERLFQEKQGLDNYNSHFNNTNDEYRVQEQREYEDNVEREIDDKEEKCGRSKSILELSDSPYVPEYCHVVAKTKIYNDKLQTNNSSFTIDFEANDFKSHDAYCQGLNLKYSETAKGNTKNMYLVLLQFETITNYFPTPIAITLQQTIPGNVLQLKDLPNKNSVFKNNKYHCIVPPGTHNNLKLYMSTNSINNTFGKEYPTMSYETVTKGIVKFPKMAGLVKRHPCARWYFIEAEINNLEPAELAEEDGVEYFKISKTHSEQAVKAIQDIITNELQIVNIDRLKMQVSVLHDSELQQQLSEEQNNKIKGISYTLSSKHIFRDPQNIEEEVTHEEVGLERIREDTISNNTLLQDNFVSIKDVW